MIEVFKRQKHIWLLVSSFFALILFSACSQRSQPAPVTELYQGKTFRDFDAQGYSGASYQVQEGDTLYSIAWYSGNDYRDLAKINRIPAPYHIYPGQLLQLVQTVENKDQKSQNKTGQTSKTIVNQSVDPAKKQEYGESRLKIKQDSVGSSIGYFPDRVKSWVWPSSGAVIQGFSAAEAGNKGLDFSGKLGSSILAAADGKVVYTGNALRGFGNLVIIKHSEAYLTAYAHNDKILVKEQQWVTANQKIATMGRSGTDKVKLHFEVRYKGKSVDPLRFLPKR
ncbi:peptidoglycan DD-metalloendopeptidase family protein [Paraglaciecola aestuariivivens]